MLRLLPRIAPALGALLLCAAPTLAADVTNVIPANRIVVVDEGRAASIVVTADCKTQWTVFSDNPAVTVSAAPNKAVSKLAVKVIAAAGSFGQMANVSITGTCDKTALEVNAMVFVAMNQRAGEKQFAKSAAIQRKNLALAVKQAEKNFNVELKMILAAVKQGDLDADDFVNDPLVKGLDPGPGGGGSGGHLGDEAQMASSYAERRFFTAIYLAYYLAMSNLASQGFGCLISYFAFSSYIPYVMPLAFMSGGCGTWDRFHSGAFALMSLSMLRMSLAMKKFNLSMKAVAKKNGSDIPSTETDTTVQDPGTGGADPSTGETGSDADKTFEINKVKAWNYANDEGNSHGRIRVTGRATTGDVRVQITRDGDEILDDTFSTSECAFMVFHPPASEEGTLDPGTYTVTVTDDDGNTESRNITVPVR